MKVNNTDSTTTSTSYTYTSPSRYQSEKGWECPRCGRINAPWVRQCDCSPSAYTVSCDKITINPNDNWWKDRITCNDDTFKIHPDSITYTTSTNQAVGGSDYKDSATGNWTNVPKTYTNSTKE